MEKILIIDDDEELCELVSEYLTVEGFEIETVHDGETGLNEALKEEHDLVILDVMLPKKNGFDVCRDLRKEGIETPILMLTAKGETIDKVLGLKLGADDYLTKPFEMMELLARIEAILRRSPKTSTNGSKNNFQFGDVEIDFKRAEVLKNKSTIELSAMEFKLLQFLIENRGNVHSRDELLDAVWGYDAMPTTRTVDVHIAWLRQKLEANPKHPKYIQTVHGFGYKFSD